MSVSVVAGWKEQVRSTHGTGRSGGPILESCSRVGRRRRLHRLSKSGEVKLVGVPLAVYLLIV